MITKKYIENTRRAIEMKFFAAGWAGRADSQNSEASAAGDAMRGFDPPDTRDARTADRSRVRKGQGGAAGLASRRKKHVKKEGECFV